MTPLTTYTGGENSRLLVAVNMDPRCLYFGTGRPPINVLVVGGPLDAPDEIPSGSTCSHFIQTWRPQ